MDARRGGGRRPCGKVALRAGAGRAGESFDPMSIIVVSVINQLAAMRKARGISAVDLAAQVGVTRQAIYAIEAGTYMPNTAVALRLSRALDSTVEGLFELEPE